MSLVSNVNRRKEQRVPVTENVYVVIDTQPKMMGQMVDISSTGMAFNFVDLNSVSQLLNGRHDIEVDVFAAGKGFFIRNMPARLISLVDISSNNVISSMKIKRIGVEFVSPSIAQQVQINTLVRRQGAGKETAMDRIAAHQRA